MKPRTDISMRLSYNLQTPSCKAAEDAMLKMLKETVKNISAENNGILCEYPDCRNVEWDVNCTLLAASQSLQFHIKLKNVRLVFTSFVLTLIILIHLWASRITSASVEMLNGISSDSLCSEFKPRLGRLCLSTYRGRQNKLSANKIDTIELFQKELLIYWFFYLLLRRFPLLPHIYHQGFAGRLPGVFPLLKILMLFSMQTATVFLLFWNYQVLYVCRSHRRPYINRHVSAH